MRTCNLIVDQGNTLCKVAVIEAGEVVVDTAFDCFDLERVYSLVGDYSPRRAVVCSTRGDAEEIVRSLKGRVEYVLHARPGIPMPIEIDYATPQTLGMDRVALVLGVRETLGIQDALVFDLGSAMTIDRLEKGRFCGGNISLGLAMRYRALHEFTACLPLVEPDQALRHMELGSSTQSAIMSGVENSLLYEIEGYVRDFLKKNPEGCTVFCGGDSIRLEKTIKNAIFASRNTMYLGLNIILEYNATEVDK